MARAQARAGSNYTFLTQKERDIETGLDYFLARYYSSTQGRFTSPDEFKGGPEELFTFADSASANPTFYADLINPQSLNKYQYAYNNPLRYIDPDGHDVIGYELIANGQPNNIPNQDNREQVDVKTIGPKDSATGAYYLTNVKVTFNDNPADYKSVRAAIFRSSLNNDVETRNYSDENPHEKGQTRIAGQSRFVTDTPGLNIQGRPKAELAGSTFQAIFVQGEYNKKTKSLDGKVFFYAVQVVIGKDGKIDKTNSKAFEITRAQYLNYAQQFGVKVRKDKKGQVCPECLLSPPNAPAN